EATNGGAVSLSGSWTNAASGQINATGGTASLNGVWSNSGVVNVNSSGTVVLGGNLTLASLGALNRTPSANGGTVALARRSRGQPRQHPATSGRKSYEFL